MHFLNVEPVHHFNSIIDKIIHEIKTRRCITATMAAQIDAQLLPLDVTEPGQLEAVFATLAGQAGMCLIGFLRLGGCVAYTGQERLSAE